jgi:5-oxopent-3-ene-1,2,5-tricarboxylate decarboxylase / 2-hydroxyhepta-2,4-diene-1,7-dioate isomerase
MAKAFVKISGMPHITEAEVDPETHTVVLHGTPYRVHEISWEVPISGTVYGVLLNYKGVFEQYHEQMTKPPYKGPPKAPVLFMKPVNTFNAYGGFIPLPKDATELEIGATLGVVIGRMATKVHKEKAFDFVAGYTVVNDVTIPHQNIYRPAIKEKARDGFCPIGPWVIGKEAVEDPHSLNIRVLVNGDVVQKNHTQNLVRPVAQLIAEITEFMTLYPGDVLLAGVPEHPPLVKAGDHVRIEIDRVGVLENTVVHEKDWVKEAFL